MEPNSNKILLEFISMVNKANCLCISFLNNAKERRKRERFEMMWKAREIKMERDVFP